MHGLGKVFIAKNNNELFSKLEALLILFDIAFIISSQKKNSIETYQHLIINKL